MRDMRETANRACLVCRSSRLSSFFRCELLEFLGFGYPRIRLSSLQNAGGVVLIPGPTMRLSL